MRQRVLLGALVVVLLIVGWVYLMPGADDAAPPRPAGRGAGAIDADVGVAAALAPAPSGRPAAGAFTVVSASDAAQGIEPLRLAALSRPPPRFTTGRHP